MIIGIVGSRRRNTFKDKQLLIQKLDELWKKSGLRSNEVIIVTGDCKTGGDRFATMEAVLRGFILMVKRVQYPKRTVSINGEMIEPNYYDYVNAYYRRNEEIAKEPLDYLIAIVAEDRKGGTENTIKHFKKYHEDWEKKLILI